MEGGSRSRSRSRWGGGGFMALPGTYSVSLAKEEKGEIITLSGPETFEVKPLRKGALPGNTFEEIAAFQADLNAFNEKYTIASKTMNYCKDKMRALRTALDRSDSDKAHAIVKEWYAVNQKMTKLDLAMSGSAVKDEIGEKGNPTVRSRYSTARRAASYTYGPTKTHLMSLELAKEQLQQLEGELMELSQTAIPAIEKALKNVGAPIIQAPTMPKN